MKKKRLDQKDSIPLSLSPAERLPAEILQQIFSDLDLRELAGIAPVSKFWNEQSGQDPRWREFYSKEFQELNRISDNQIPPNIARKQYLEFKKISGKIKSNDKKTLIEIFKNAVKKNDLVTVQVLLKDKILDINVTFKYKSFWNYGSCSGLTLVHYAAMKGNPNMVKLLLLHGADVTKKVDWVRSSRGGNYDITNNVLTDEHLFLSHSLKSLVCIGYAEHFLFKNDFTTAIEYFEKSNKYDPKIISEYIQQVNQDKMGFKFNYNEKLERKLGTWYKGISERPERPPSHCTIT